jgi:hypothetical protein
LDTEATSFSSVCVKIVDERTVNVRAAEYGVHYSLLMQSVTGEAES